MILRRTVLGIEFQNPVLLAAGTCGFGMELADVLDLEALGGIVTKSVTLEPREGNPSPRVAEIPDGMLNSIGLANPGVEGVIRDKLPWIRDSLHRARCLVSVAGHTTAEYVAVVERMEPEEGFQAFELNLSCPNVGGIPFALDLVALDEVVRAVRPVTRRPLVVKLAPNAPDLPRTAETAQKAGADAVTLVNTLPGLALDPGTGRPRLGAGGGGMSGPALKAVGVAAVRKVREGATLPILGVGGILNADDALEYFRAGASLVQVGTASFAAPRAAERLIAGLEAAVRREGCGTLDELVPDMGAGRSIPATGERTEALHG
jgi:dihydroorotate dehydrogenase (NAD+) catalytic subunit